MDKIYILMIRGIGIKDQDKVVSYHYTIEGAEQAMPELADKTLLKVQPYKRNVVRSYPYYYIIDQEILP